MSTFKKAKVILLPTGFIARRNEIGLQAYKTNLRIINNTEEEDLIFYQQHLYIISGDEIKEGDWYLSFDIYGKCGLPIKADYEKTNEFSLKPYSNYCKKIIATTDIALELPQPSQQFIQKFVEEYNKGNVITDVLVEYQTDFKSETKLYMLSMGDNPDDFKYGEPTIKINPKDNTITIKIVKDCYTREEFTIKLKQFKKDCINNYYAQIINMDIDKWIEENL